MNGLLCSSDAVAAISIINYDAQPKLFSLVFGEGITNDAVSIILFNTILKYTVEEEFTYDTPVVIIGNFLSLGLFSLLIGIGIALIASYIIKKFRFLTHSPVHEIMLVFCFGYLSYTISEMAH